MLCAQHERACLVAKLNNESEVLALIIPPHLQTSSTEAQWYLGFCDGIALAIAR